MVTTFKSILFKEKVDAGIFMSKEMISRYEEFERIVQGG